MISEPVLRHKIIELFYDENGLLQKEIERVWYQNPAYVGTKVNVKNKSGEKLVRPRRDPDDIKEVNL